MKTPSLSEQMNDHTEGRERLEFGRQVEREAIKSERDNIDDYLQKRINLLNSRGQVGDTFRVDELLARQREIRAGIHAQSEPKQTKPMTTNHLSDCDGCTTPQGTIKPITVTGAEGDFCHACRHGSQCDCETPMATEPTIAEVLQYLREIVPDRFMQVKHTVEFYPDGEFPAETVEYFTVKAVERDLKFFATTTSELIDHVRIWKGAALSAWDTREGKANGN